MEAPFASHHVETSTDRMVTNSPTAIYFARAIEVSGLTQKEIACRSGLPKPNVISMMKRGETKIPLARIPDLARAVGVEPQEFLATAMAEYQPEVWQVLRANFSI